MKSSTMLRLSALPPSVNALYFNAGRCRVRTQIYRNWQEAMCLEVKLQRPKKIVGDCYVEYVYGPRTRRRDLMNMEKATSDLLVKAKVIQDDKHIVEGRIRWGEIQGCMILVRAVSIAGSAPS